MTVRTQSCASTHTVIARTPPEPTALKASPSVSGADLVSCSTTETLRVAPCHARLPQVQPLNRPALKEKNVRKEAQAIAKIPDEIGLLILDQAQANPLQLMALISVDGRPCSSPVLGDLAHLNCYWKQFTPDHLVVAGAAEGTYAEAFLARYHALPLSHRVFLHDLWSGKMSVKEIRVKWVGDRTLPRSYDISLAAVSRRDGYLPLCHLHIPMQRESNIEQAARLHTPIVQLGFMP